MSIYSDLAKECLRSPSFAARGAFPRDDTTPEGRALRDLTEFCRGNHSATIAQILREFDGTETGLILSGYVGMAVVAKRQDDDVDHFLLSREWQVVRLEVLARDGGRCCLCGRTAADGVVIQVDHIKPRSRHPKLALHPDNLQVLCRPCNRGKGDKYETDWRHQPQGEQRGDEQIPA